MKKTLIFAFFLLGAAPRGYAQTLDAELARLKTNLALVVYSGAVEERSLWSPRSDYVACRVMGKWIGVSLHNLALTPDRWHGKRVGLLKSSAAPHELSADELSLFRAASEVQPILIRTRAGTRYALQPEGEGSVLVATRADGQIRRLWSSGGEPCYSLSLSPDEKYLACLGERSGLLLTKIE
ncbi:MAG: hypothetical protein H7Z75_05070 [Ferruginibacter sp.]|nr:hypothetical protein [Cytophagales bacterium]